jgi:NADPH2:quinone reductase
MKAILCTHHGLPETLIYSDIDDPVLEEKEVLIQVKACAVNFPDVLLIQDKYQFKPPLPFSPGGEVSGIIEKTGAPFDRPNPKDGLIGLAMIS